MKHKISFFQSHGEQDPVLSIEGAVGLKNLLTECGHEVKFFKFSGQHEIPPNILQETVRFLEQ